MPLHVPWEAAAMNVVLPTWVLLFSPTSCLLSAYSLRSVKETCQWNCWCTGPKGMWEE